MPDENDQFLAPCHACVNKVALQKQVLLRRQGRDDRRELRTLRLVDRDCVRQRDFIKFPEVVNDLSLIESDCDLALNGRILTLSLI